MDLRGIVGQIVSFTRNLVGLAQLKVNLSGGDLRTFTHTSSPGDDSAPLLTDKVTGIPLSRTGTWAAVGYTDPLNLGIALLGEKRIYSRALSGTVVASVHLKGDGAVEVQNAAGSFTLTAVGGLQAIVTTISIGNGAGTMSLDASGTWDFNGVKISPAGEITNAAGIVLGTHAHAGSPTAATGPVSPTGVPLP